MHKFHQQLLKEIKQKEPKKKSDFNLGKYLGTPNYCYALSSPIKKGIAKNWLKSHKDIKSTELAKLLDSLFRGKSFEEKTLAPLLLILSPKLRKEIKPKYLDKWLGYLEGWAEVDSLCQSTFTSDELLSNWNSWKKVIVKFSKTKNVSKRRASLVLLTHPVAQSKDERLVKLAFKNIDILKGEKDILITKAISWLLRALIKNNKKLVANYLVKNRNHLPKIAIRETYKKLRTGKKN